MKISLFLSTIKRYHRLIKVINQLSEVSDVVELVIGIYIDDETCDDRNLINFAIHIYK
jgi:hypothetical protein